MFIFLFIFLNLLNLSAHSSISDDLVEEGWRYRNDLSLILIDNVGKVKSQIISSTIEHIHRPMAYMVDSAKGTKGSYGLEGFPSQKDRLFSCFRFSSITEDSNGLLKLGETITINSNMIEKN